MPERTCGNCGHIVTRTASCSGPGFMRGEIGCNTPACDNWIGQSEGVIRGALVGAVTRLRAERDRYRATLERIKALPHYHTTHNLNSPGNVIFGHDPATCGPCIAAKTLEKEGASE